VQLLKDSEKLFYQKIKETKKESEALNDVFKQVWPLIKHKVRDPTGLLKTIGLENQIDSTTQPTSQPPVTAVSTEESDSLRREIETLKKGMAFLKEELSVERENR